MAQWTLTSEIEFGSQLTAGIYLIKAGPTLSTHTEDFYPLVGAQPIFPFTVLSYFLHIIVGQSQDWLF